MFVSSLREGQFAHWKSVRVSKSQLTGSILTLYKFHFLTENRLKHTYLTD